jgi:hypothetical protein
VTERKGSSDSLTSQKSIESQRSSDSQSSAPVRDTLHKAKRQIQALIGKQNFLLLYLTHVYIKIFSLSEISFLICWLFSGCQPNAFLENECF